MAEMIHSRGEKTKAFGSSCRNCPLRQEVREAGHSEGPDIIWLQLVPNTSFKSKVLHTMIHM